MSLFSAAGCIKDRTVHQHKGPGFESPELGTSGICVDRAVSPWEEAAHFVLVPLQSSILLASHSYCSASLNLKRGELRVIPEKVPS